MTPILLDRNENRYGPAPECLAALRTTPPESLFNYTRDFQRGFFSPLSRRLADLHVVPEKRIILGYGCEDLLKQAIHHWVQPGEPLLEMIRHASIDRFVMEAIRVREPRRESIQMSRGPSELFS